MSPELLETVARAVRAQGYVHLQAVVSPDLCAEAVAAFREEVRPFTGPLLRQLSAREEPHALGPDGLVRNPVHCPFRLAQFPRFCQLESRIFAETALVPLVAGVLGEPVALLQSAYYESSAGTELHPDQHPLSPEGAMLGAWVALERITPAAGRFFVAPGTHLLDVNDPDVAWFLRCAGARYRGLFLTGELSQGAEDPEGTRALRRLVDRGLIALAAPALEAGDVVLWLRQTLHGSYAPAGTGASRNSLVLHFVPQATLPRP